MVKNKNFLIGILISFSIFSPAQASNWGFSQLKEKVGNFFSFKGIKKNSTYLSLLAAAGLIGLLYRQVNNQVDTNREIEIIYEYVNGIFVSNSIAQADKDKQKRKQYDLKKQKIREQIISYNNNVAKDKNDINEKAKKDKWQETKKKIDKINDLTKNLRMTNQIGEHTTKVNDSLNHPGAKSGSEEAKADGENFWFWDMSTIEDMPSENSSNLIVNKEIYSYKKDCDQKKYQGECKKIKSLKFIDNKTLLILAKGSYGDRLYNFDLHSGKGIRTPVLSYNQNDLICELEKRNYYPDKVLSYDLEENLELSHNGKLFLVAYTSKKDLTDIRIFDTNSLNQQGKTIKIDSNDELVNKSIAFSKEDKKIAYITRNKTNYNYTIHIHETETGKELLTIKSEHSLYTLDFAPGGNHIITARKGKINDDTDIFIIYNTLDGQKFKIISCPLKEKRDYYSNGIEVIRFANNYKYFFAVSNNTVKIINVQTGKVLETMELSENKYSREYYENPYSNIPREIRKNTFAQSPDGQKIAAADQYGNISVWKI